MKRKRTYVTEDIKRLQIEKLLLGLVGGCVVAIDVAKEKFVAAIGTIAGELVKLVRFDHPIETRVFLALLQVLKERDCPPTVLMEPTGTYGDAIRHQVVQQGHTVLMVQPKHTHDAKEIFDGVPSMHDPKAAVTMLQLHRSGLTRPWKEAEPARRELRALLSIAWSHDEAAERLYGKVEAMMVRHWPEFLQWLDPRQHVSARALLQRFTGPDDVARNAADSAECLRRASHGSLSQEVIDGAIGSATGTLGVPMIGAEKAQLRDWITRIDYHHRQSAVTEKEVERTVKGDKTIEAMAQALGTLTAVTVVTLLGAPEKYPCAAAYQKASGLNLRENSSGTHQSPLNITKRGPSQVRRLLYLAALRLIQRDRTARAWYMGRGLYGEDKKVAAVVAVMRKLLAGAWRVGKYGETFDTSKLFDTRRLVLTTTQPGDRPAARIGRRTQPRSITRRSKRRSAATRQGGASP